jgi:hypothetical protein
VVIILSVANFVNWCLEHNETVEHSLQEKVLGSPWNVCGLLVYMTSSHCSMNKVAHNSYWDEQYLRKSTRKSKNEKNCHSIMQVIADKTSKTIHCLDTFSL